MGTLIAVLSEMSTLVVWSVVAVGAVICDLGKNAYEAVAGASVECQGSAVAGETGSARPSSSEKPTCSAKTAEAHPG